MAGRVAGDAAARAGHLTVQAATSRAAKKAAVLVGKAAVTTGTGVVVSALLGPIVGSLVAGVTGGAMGLGGKTEGGSPPHG